VDSRSSKVAFPGAFGDTLAARLELPTGPPRAVALFAHCFTCSKDVYAATHISRCLARRGIAVLRFDFTGLGSSEGDFANTTFSSNVDDLVRAADYLRERFEAPGILIGHSLGGSAALVAAGRIAEVRAVATIGAPSDPAHVSLHFSEAVPTVQAEGEVSVSIAGRRFRIRKAFLQDINDQNLEQVLRGLNKALLIMHSPQDEVVDIEHARHIYRAARHPKSFVSLDDADHLLTRPRDADYVAGVLTAWAERYLDTTPGPDTPIDVQTPAPGVVRVRETDEGRYAQLVSVGRHRLRSDEPVDDGGDDSGPSPYDLLLAGLGACTTMTLRMYAERKGLALERVQVDLSHRKIHARDCADCETRDGRIDHIERIILIEGDLTDEQRQRMLQIADRCPVHRTLHSEVRIDSRLEDQPVSEDKLP
jgi:putative redox protein